MVRAIEGTYRDGKVELPTRPAINENSRVVVLFSESPGAVIGKVTGAERERLLEQMFAEMDMGFRLGGRPYARREDLYDRVNRW